MPSLWPFSSGSDLSSSPLQRRLYRSVPSALASKRPSDNDRKQEGNYCINFDAFRLELLLFDTFTERVMSSGEKRYINTIFILFDKTKQMGNMLCTKLRKFRKIVIIFWSCFFLWWIATNVSFHRNWKRWATRSARPIGVWSSTCLMSLRSPTRFTCSSSCSQFLWGSC